MAFVRFAQEALEVDEVVDLVEGGDKGKQRLYQGPIIFQGYHSYRVGGPPKPETLHPKP